MLTQEGSLDKQSNKVVYNKKQYMISEMCLSKFQKQDHLTFAIYSYFFQFATVITSVQLF